MKQKNNKNTEKIKVVVKKVSDDTIMCKHITSNYDIKAYITRNMHIEVGQVILLEYRVNNGGGGYIVADPLVEEVNAKVLEAQHIISDGNLYTSVILENLETHNRIHSMLSDKNELFASTNILITGDTVKMKINNGKLFSIQINNS